MKVLWVGLKITEKQAKSILTNKKLVMPDKLGWEINGREFGFNDLCGGYVRDEDERPVTWAGNNVITP